MERITGGDARTSLSVRACGPEPLSGCARGIYAPRDAGRKKRKNVSCGWTDMDASMQPGRRAPRHSAVAEARDAGAAGWGII